MTVAFVLGVIIGSAGMLLLVVLALVVASTSQAVGVCRSRRERP